ncbi:MAG: hypothetical protein JWQ40_3616 [Segetibacter sp.]|jgi:hypothetical protein|nr:hypothetical protein [Segetibacter sp.]
MMPVLAFSNPSLKYFKEDKINPEALKSGMNIKTVTKFLDGKKSTKLTDGRTSQKLKRNAIDIGNISIREAFVISDNGIITRLLLILNKKQGAKFLSNTIKKYGMPFGEMIDAYAWEINNVIFEIHETEVGYIATYKPKSPPG